MTDNGGWDERPQTGKQVHSERFPTLPEPMEVTDLETLRVGDPGLYRSLIEVKDAIAVDLVPPEAQMLLVESMSPAVRREVVAKIAGLESSVLMTFKDQIQLVDTVLRRVVMKDGTKAAGADEMGVSVKEAMNMSMKLTTALVRDLPKIYTLERIQRVESALFKIVEKFLTRDQQALVLEELERLNIKGD